MEQFIMKGGNPLVGEVTIGGAKNAALGILAASIMTDEDVLIENLPDVRDINVLLEAIQEIGFLATLMIVTESFSGWIFYQMHSNLFTKSSAVRIWEYRTTVRRIRA